MGDSLTRDSQRRKLYAAERELAEFDGPLMTLPEVEQYLAKIQGSAWFKRHYKAGTITHRPVSWGQRRGLAFYSLNQISLPVWARTKLIVLHEVAHIVAFRQGPGSPRRVDHPAHGWVFCETYLALVQHFLGADAAQRLKAAFKTNRVKFTPPRSKREVSPERRAELAERLTVARAAKAAKEITTAQEAMAVLEVVAQRARKAASRA